MVMVAFFFAVPQRLACVSRCNTIPSENILGSTTLALAIIPVSVQKMRSNSLFMRNSLFQGSKIRISERKAKQNTKFLFSFPSGSIFDEVKVTNKRAEIYKGSDYYEFLRRIPYAEDPSYL